MLSLQSVPHPHNADVRDGSWHHQYQLRAVCAVDPARHVAQLDRAGESSHPPASLDHWRACVSSPACVASPAACLSNPHQPALAPGQPASVLSSAACASQPHQPPPRPHQAIFHVLLLLLFASYLHCVLTDPGTVPQAWHDRIASDPQLAARYRLCHKSGLYRPPRSHYCSVTERTLTLTPTPTLTQPNPQPQPQLHPHPRPSPNSNPKPHPHAQA